MANRATHMVLGGGTTLTLYVLYKKLIKKEKLTLGGVLGSVGLGVIGGALPDLIEPATDPNHRKFFHSIALVLIAALGKEKLYEMLGFSEEKKRYFDWFLVAYGSHLICDSRTPKGLPTA